MKDETIESLEPYVINFNTKSKRFNTRLSDREIIRKVISDMYDRFNKESDIKDLKWLVEHHATHEELIERINDI